MSVRREAILDRSGRVLAAAGSAAHELAQATTRPGSDLAAACAGLGRAGAELLRALGEVQAGAASRQVRYLAEDGRGWRARLTRLEGGQQMFSLAHEEEAEEELLLHAGLQRVLGALIALGLEELPFSEQLRQALLTIASLPELPLDSRGAVFLAGRVAAAVGVPPEELPQQAPPDRCPCGAALAGEVRACPGQGGSGPLRDPHLALALGSEGKQVGVCLLFLREGAHDIPPGPARAFVRAAARAVAAFVARRAAEEAARRVEVRLRDIVGSIPGVVFKLELSPDGAFRIPYVSEPVTELFGVPRDELAVGDPFRHIDERDREAMRAGFLASARTIEEHAGEFRVQDQVTGEVRWAFVRARPRPLEGGGVLWNGVSLDVTERKRIMADLERAKELAETADRARTRLLANVSHETRTPLNAVLGLTDLLLASGLAPEQLEWVRTIRAGGDQLRALIDDLLDLASMEPGRLQLRRQPFSLRGCVDDALALLAHGPSGEGRVIRLVADPGLSERWTGDETRLRQVLLNLLHHAVELGAVRLTVTGSAEGGLRFAVEGDGPGVPPAALERLFDPFGQVDPSAARRHGGTGLGLAIAKRIVEEMGGRIGAESPPGRGTTIWFTLPPAPPPEPAAAPAATAGRPARILLADDQELNRRVAVALLRHLGHEPDLATNGAEACRLATTRDYDLVLMDLQMPIVDGVGAARRIRAELGTRSPRIVALTASAVPEELSLCRAAGIDECLVKPVDVAQLERVLARALGPGQELARGPAAQLGPDGLRELVEVFLADAPGLMAALRRGLAEGESGAVARAAHALKGSFLVLGAEQAAGLCHDLERMAREGSLVLAVERALEVERELERTRERLVGMLDQR